MADRVGQLLGNYQLTKLLGQGGFAEVYLGQQIYLKTPGAIKLLHTKGASQKELDDFFKEAQAIAKLSHPNIIHVLDFGMEEKTPYLIMDYAPNGTLRQRHPRKTQVPLTTVLTYVKQIAAALQYAHDADIIHRDVKPDNMLIAQEDRIWLSDFGIALTAHSSTAISTQDAIGTIAYMAPEQFQGKPRRASDQYALGVVVYEWLTGERPFHGSFAEIGMQHMHAIPAPLREKVPTLGAEVEKVVLRALVKDPLERYGSVAEFAKELEQAERASRVIELAPRYRKGILRIPRRMILKQVSQPEEETLTPALRASNRTETAPTTIQQTRSEPIRVGKSQVRHSISRWQIGLLAALAALVVAVPFLYPMAASALFSHPLSAATKPMTAYDKNALANGMMFGYDAAHTRVNPYEKTITPENVNKLKPYWSAALDGQPSSPTVVNGMVYVGSSNGILYAFKADCATPCKPSWKSSPLDQIAGPSPAVAGDVVYITTGKDRGTLGPGLLYAFSAHGCKHATCKPLWIGHTNKPIYSSPTIANNMVYISSSDRNLYAFKASATCDYNCNPKWVGILNNNAYDTPAVSGKFVYIGDNKGIFYAFDISGCKGMCLPVWTATTGGPISGSVAVADGFIYTGSTYMPQTNSHTDNNLHVFNTSCTTPTCGISWIYPTGKSIESSPAISGKIVYFGSDDGYLYAFSTTCLTSPCRYLWRGQTKGAISYSSPTVANGVVYIGSGDHYVYAFRDSSFCAADPCSPLWKFDLKWRVSSSPVVANGVLYVGEQDAASQPDPRYLYAFRIPNAIH